MTATLAIELPTCLTLQGKSRAELEQRSKFRLALKYFELGEITSGQAAQMAGMGRVALLNEVSRSGVAVIDMDEEEMEREFAHVWRTENAGRWEGDECRAPNFEQLREAERV